ncbi:MAG: DegT/DnrJ/EryC1/StrS family aminotransferase [Pirellulales bacterium]|nr:DegT/DnrJ/EryC1/StrS family aminotransferase [Pirellulales bacterium]
MRFDLGWRDVAFGVRSMCARLDRDALNRRIRECWPRPEQMVPFLSVRSGFDLLWASLDLPPGSEVLMSALTIPDMVRIVEHHGLLPVPVDLNAANMAPELNAIRRAITPATRAIVVAHLFGTRVLLEPILEIARQHGLLVIEDCAQAFDGCHDDGHPNADVTMFSFGPIKTITALGGGVLCVRNAELLAKIESLHGLYPVQSRGSYLKRFTKYSVLMGLSSRPLCDAILAMYRAAGFDYDHWINGVVRAFPGPGWLEGLRHQPSAPLLAMLERRLRMFNPAWITARIARAQHLIRRLPAGVVRPGSAARDNSYWVFPVLADDPGRLAAELAEAGFDTTRGGSLRPVEPPEDRPELDPKTARRILAGMVFMPLCPQMPRREIERLAGVLGQLEDCLIIDPTKVEPPKIFPRTVVDVRSG